ncbi:hypothetical protein CRG98_033483 [Punica granatum]|uniref:Uncharacterized protein n=1 Tax=Punica granatum TaxID=22663 RepID=A0A2I0IR52_PUNGR|nr:hypothetical protein CRG98_033483 [Punica granatum]
MAEEPETTSLPTSTPPPPPPTPSEKSSQGTFNPQPQVPFVSRFIGFDGGDMQMFPVIYPAVIPGVNSQNQDQSNWGAGLYAVPVGPNMRTVAGLHSDTLIPLTYNIPTYQTGALSPLIRWLSQGMQRAAAPPHPPRAAPAVAENAPPAAGGQGNENANLPAEGQAGAENENPAANDGNRAAENVNVAEPGAGNGANHWWGIVKEIQMIVFGFMSSLLPGFHNID